MLQALDDQYQKRQTPNQDALLAQLGGSPQPPTQADYAKHFADGTKAGQDMSWMQQQGLMAPVDPIPSQPQPFANDARGFLTNSLQGIAGQVRGITGQDDSARKSFVETHIKGLLPELAARGMTVDDVRGEKINVGGRWIDLMRDVADGRGGGAAEVQWLEEDPNAGGGGMAAPSVGALNPLLTGDPMAGIQAAIGQYSQPSRNLQALLAQLGA